MNDQKNDWLSAEQAVMPNGDIATNLTLAHPKLPSIVIDKRPVPYALVVLGDNGESIRIWWRFCETNLTIAEKWAAINNKKVVTVFTLEDVTLPMAKAMHEVNGWLKTGGDIKPMHGERVQIIVSNADGDPSASHATYNGNHKGKELYILDGGRNVTNAKYWCATPPFPNDWNKK